MQWWSVELGVVRMHGLPSTESVPLSNGAFVVPNFIDEPLKQVDVGVGRTGRNGVERRREWRAIDHH